MKLIEAVLKNDIVSLIEYVNHYDHYRDTLGIDINAKDELGKTALHWVIQNDMAHFIDPILQVPNINLNIPDDRNEKMPLHYIADTKNSYLLNKLISAGADINAVDRDGKTLLHLIVKQGDVGLALILIDAGTDVNIQDAANSTALHAAFQLGHFELAEMIMTKGKYVQMDVQDEVLNTPLHYASMLGYSNVLTLIVSSPDMIDQVNADGATALHYAIQGDHNDLVRILLDYDPNLNVKRHFDHATPLHLACKSNNTDISEALLQQVDQFTLNIKDKEGKTPLHLACERGNILIAQKILELGADINIRSLSGDTALDLLYLYEVSISDDEVKRQYDERKETLSDENSWDTLKTVLSTLGKDYKFIEDSEYRTYKKVLNGPLYHHIILAICFTSTFTMSRLRQPLHFVRSLIRTVKVPDEMKSQYHMEIPGSEVSDIAQIIKTSLQAQNPYIIQALIIFYINLKRSSQKIPHHRRDFENYAQMIQKVIETAFDCDSMDEMQNVLKVLIPSLAYQITPDMEKKKLLQLQLQCFQSNAGIIPLCLHNQCKFMFGLPQIGEVVGNVFIGVGKGSLKTPFSFEGSIMLRYCPAVMFAMEFVSKATFIVLVAYVSMNVYADDIFYENTLKTNHTLQAVVLDNSISWVQVCVYLYLICNILYELGQIGDSITEIGDFMTNNQFVLVRGVIDYFCNQWNILDWISIILTTLWAIISRVNGNIAIARICLALSVIPECIGLLRYMSVFQTLGLSVVILKAMTTELFIFIVVFGLVATGFGILFYSLFKQTLGLYNTWNTIIFVVKILLNTVTLDVINPLMTSSTDDNLAVQNQPNLAYFSQACILVFVTITVILLLNLLIARMSNAMQVVVNESFTEWMFIKSLTVKEFLLLREKTNLNTLPPPFNMITFLLMFIQFLLHFQSKEEHTLSIGGTFANLYLSFTTGFFIRFYVVFKRLFHDSFKSRHQIYLFFKNLFLAVFYPVYVLIHPELRGLMVDTEGDTKQYKMSYKRPFVHHHAHQLGQMNDPDPPDSSPVSPTKQGAERGSLRTKALNKSRSRMFEYRTGNERMFDISDSDNESDDDADEGNEDLMPTRTATQIARKPQYDQMKRAVVQNYMRNNSTNTAWNFYSDRVRYEIDENYFSNQQTNEMKSNKSTSVSSRYRPITLYDAKIPSNRNYNSLRMEAIYENKSNPSIKNHAERPLGRRFSSKIKRLANLSSEIDGTGEVKDEENEMDILFTPEDIERILRPLLFYNPRTLDFSDKLDLQNDIETLKMLLRKEMKQDIQNEIQSLKNSIDGLVKMLRSEKTVDSEN